MDIHTDVVIVGCGVAGLYSALKLPRDMQIVMLTKSDAESSDSFLAQGGICVQRDDEDYDSYFEDTMKAGHYENRRESVDIMIRGSRPVIQDLVEYGVRFEQEDGEFVYTREGAHSRPRILFHEDITGKEITGTLLSRVRELPNVTLYEYTAMTDIIVEDGACRGVLAEDVRDIWKDAKPQAGISDKQILDSQGQTISQADISDKQMLNFLEKKIGLSTEKYKLCKAYKFQEILSGFDTSKTTEQEMRRQSHLVVKAGAVFAYQVLTESNDIEELLQQERKGIGEQTQHGFGKVRICDSFHTQYDARKGDSHNG